MADAVNKKDSRVVFVRGISFDVKDEKPLEEMFSNVGPVNSCFLVRDKGAEKHKGFGFVTFALPEDAQRAVDELNNTPLAGRKMQLEVANKRAPLADRKRKRPEDGEQEDSPAGEPAEAAGFSSQEKSGKAAGKAAGKTAGKTADKLAAKAAEKPTPANKAERKVEPAAPSKASKSSDKAAAKAEAKAQAKSDSKPADQPTSVDKPATKPVTKPGAKGSEAPQPDLAKPTKAAQAAATSNGQPKPDKIATPALAEAVLNKGRAKGGRAAGPAQGARPDGATGQAKHKHMLTVAVGGLLTAAQVSQVVTLASSCGPVVEVVNPAPLDVVEKAHLKSDGCSGLEVLLVFNTVQEALDAVTKLHGVKLGAPAEPKGKGKGKAKEAAAAVPSEQETAVLWARQLAGEGAYVRKWRVIVRNVAFKATEVHLRAALGRAGFVWEMSMPKGADGRFKGYAFAAYTLRAHAERAIALVNGSVIGGRPVAVDWAVAKSTYDAAEKTVAGGTAPAPFKPEPSQGKSLGDSDSDYGSDGEDESDFDSEDGEESEDNGDEGEDAEAGWQGEQAREGDDEAEGEDGGVLAGERAMMHGVLAGIVGEEEQEGNVVKGKAGKAEAEAKEARAKAPVKPAQDAQGEAPARPPPEYLNRTVFVRGLPLDITSATLQLKLESYGHVKACRVVMDKVSGKPKGTAFVEFETLGAAVKAADACARGRQMKGPGVMLSGRTLDVDLAVAQDAARQLAVGKAGHGEKGKRNLHLAKEGEIQQGTPAWLGMSDHDREKRSRANDDKKTKLQSPNFLISPVRLSIRNIPFSMTEAQLRALAVRAVSERATNEKAVISQVKILREPDGGKLDKDGKPRSKGLGFLEFEQHDHAVACLRQLNNNPVAFTKDRRPIVEFAIDNVKVLKKLEAIRARVVQQQAIAAGEEVPGRPAKRTRLGDGEPEDGEAPPRVLTPRERKKAKAKAKVLRRKERGQQLKAEAGGAEEGAEGAASPVATGKKKLRKERREQQRLAVAGGAEPAPARVAAARKGPERQPKAPADAGVQGAGAQGAGVEAAGDAQPAKAPTAAEKAAARKAKAAERKGQQQLKKQAAVDGQVGLATAAGATGQQQQKKHKLAAGDQPEQSVEAGKRSTETKEQQPQKKQRQSAGVQPVQSTGAGETSAVSGDQTSGQAADPSAPAQPSKAASAKKLRKGAKKPTRRGKGHGLGAKPVVPVAAEGTEGAPAGGAPSKASIRATTRLATRRAAQQQEGAPQQQPGVSQEQAPISRPQSGITRGSDGPRAASRPQPGARRVPDETEGMAGVRAGSKRHADNQMDRLADDALASMRTGGDASGKRRRGGEVERTDRLDKLAEDYRSKLSRDKVPASRQHQAVRGSSDNTRQSKGAPRPGRDQGAQESKGARPQQKQQHKQKPAAAAAPLQLGLAAGSIKRWFDDAS